MAANSGEVIDIGQSSAEKTSSDSYDTEEENNRQRNYTENGLPKSKRERTKKLRVYRKEWEKLPELKDWISDSKTSKCKAWCRYCKCDINAHLTELRRHGKVQKHLKNVDEERKAISSTQPMENFTRIPASEDRKTSELKIAAYIADSAIAFRRCDGLVDLIRTVGKKDQNIKKLKMGRTKCTKLITRVLGPGFRRMLLQDIGNGKFSLIIDESNDISTLPMLSLVIRYLSQTQKKLVTTFYRMVRLQAKDAETITNAILTVLKDDGLDIQNLVGLGTDGANTLIGRNSGVITRLREYQPELVLVQCICHSLAKAAEYAFKQLPGHLEILVRDVYGYFSKSSARKDRYNELYANISGSAPKKILKLHNVRWLSLYQCVDVILNQWDELVKFFDHEKDSSDPVERYTARQLRDMLTDYKNKAYLIFCRSFLKQFVEKNLLFQADSADVLRLVNELELFYLSHINMVEFGFEFLETVARLDDETQLVVKQRCQSCLVEAAKQVQLRLPASMNSLKLIESLSPANVLEGIIGGQIVLLLQRFRTLTADIESAYDELKSIPLVYKPSQLEFTNCLEFWLEIYGNKDAAGNSRFANIAKFALNLLCLPFSNASVERVFSAMNLVKTKLRNRLVCETVEAVLSVRYGLKLNGSTPSTFDPPREMLRSFNSDMYTDAGDSDDADLEHDDLFFSDVYDAVDALDAAC